MNDAQKCPDCGAVHEWTATEQPDGSYVVSAGDTAISLVSASACGFSKSQARWVGYMLCKRICLERQLAQAKAEQRASPDAAQQRIIELKDALEDAAVAATRQFERVAELSRQIVSLQNRPVSLRAADNVIESFRRKLSEATGTTKYRSGGPSFDALMSDNKRLREIVDLCAIWFEVDDEERKSMGGDDRMREALAAREGRGSEGSDT